MPENTSVFSRLPTISTRRTASASKYSTSSRNGSRASCHSFSPKGITPIRASRSALSMTPRSTLLSSNCDSFSNQSVSDLSCEDPTEYQQRRNRMKDGKFGKLFQNYFPEKVDAPPEISEPSDDEPYETDLEEDLGTNLIKQEKGLHRHEHEYKYGQFCEQLKVVPNNYFLRHGKTEELNMKFRYLNYGDATAMTKLIKTQDLVSKLNLSENGIGPAAMLSIGELLLHNKTITEMNLANNKIGVYGARLTKIIMQNNNKLTKIDISGNNIGEKGGVHSAHIIQNNIYLKEFNLANNRIGDKGTIAIGKALGNNVTLELLDISWNHIQLPGALAVARGMKSNDQLKVLRVSMNGFGKLGTQALIEHIPHISLTELDLSSNRIDGDGAMAIADVLKKHSKLEILQLNNNTLSVEGVNKMVQMISSNTNCHIKHLGLKKVTVDGDFITAAENLKSQNISVEYSLDFSQRKSARELTRHELEDFAAILEQNGVSIRDVFDDVISANSLMRVEDFLYLVEMSDRCSNETVKVIRRNTVESKNHRFILKNLLSIEEELKAADEICTSNRKPEEDVSDVSSGRSSVPDMTLDNNQERLWTPSVKTRKKSKKSKSKRK
ncbi:hypothetical protein LOTGIDRAFT_232622 [Lottia gigantea]|uniref:CARD domain-containing protein n=1 Tax=Lottia gigantea TaxID=225164 RepID=V3ZQ99_LOTGI|nr:hypothetical protein LOTGIDRAFT_232622 [Lottia gigantea]ESO93568.1 hypothetical protein LOTGIDRAFT_232622 [Lottia gigantea]